MREYKYEWDILYLKCNKCWRFLTTENYNKDRSKLFWFRTNCNDCRRIWRASYYKLNKSKILEYWGIWSKKNKMKIDGYKKKYRENNKIKVAKCQKNNREKHNNELWFNWDIFHQKAIKYVKKYKLRPKKCPICRSDKNIVMHHPSYNSYEDWSKVVFCCQWCHKLIHKWEIKCPDVINLLNI